MDLSLIYSRRRYSTFITQLLCLLPKKERLMKRDSIMLRVLLMTIQSSQLIGINSTLSNIMKMANLTRFRQQRSSRKLTASMISSTVFMGKQFVIWELLQPRIQMLICRKLLIISNLLGITLAKISVPSQLSKASMCLRVTINQFKMAFISLKVLKIDFYSTLSYFLSLKRSL